ncbi:MAG: hypothetical protein HYW57_08880 [Ignavibacteriales bacterium]|nr:hypothetical protein [Ignavibacteriales bacterium]
MNTLTTTTKNERVNFLIPRALIRKATHMAKSNNSTTSEFFRCAIAFYIDWLEKRQIEKELEEGYLANSEYYSKMSEEWKFADSQ